MKSGRERVSEMHRLRGDATSLYFDVTADHQVACEESDACDDAIASDLDTLTAAREAAEVIREQMSRREMPERARVERLLTILTGGTHAK